LNPKSVIYNPIKVGGIQIYFSKLTIKAALQILEIKISKNTMAPKKTTGSAKATPASKQQKRRPKVVNKGGKRKRTETFSVYIYRVLKQVHPETGISKRSNANHELIHPQHLRKDSS